MTGVGFGKAKFYKNTKSNAIKIFRVLKKSNEIGEGYLSIGEISRRTGLHKWTVSRTIDLWMHHAVEMVIPEELEHVGLRVKLVRLANTEMTEKILIRSLSIRF